MFCTLLSLDVSFDILYRVGEDEDDVANRCSLHGASLIEVA